jgi:amino acid adenylation domain-containing protein/non-ribosomal peptide synthase protein (TIGR01720 family)
MSQKLTADCFPLSPMQQGMLFHYLKEPHSGVDIEQVVVHLPEEIDALRLRKAWEWLVLRHDILRARFLWEGIDQPRQEILDSVAVPFFVEEARQLSSAEQKMKLSAFLEGDRCRGFELNAAPLLRLTLFEWGESSFSLVWTFHHALLDGRCFPILLAEVFGIYAELATGKISARPEPFAYRRYIDWLQEQDFTAAQGFWKEYLTGFNAPTPLVVDHKSSKEEVAYQQGEAWEILDSTTTARLRDVAQSEDLTMNSLVMGAWAILLHRYSGEADVVFGATRACRKSSVPGADETIGLFINTVPVRVQLSDDLPLLSVFRAVRQQWLDLRRFEHSPLALVKSASQVPAVQPLFETLLVFEKYRLDTAMRSFGGAWTNRQVELHELTNFPVTLAAYDGPELSFKIEFDRRRIEEATAKRMLGHLRSLLAGVVANPGACVGDLALLNEAERQKLVESFNVPVSPPKSLNLPLDGGTTLHCVFERQVEEQPDSVALTCDGHSLTYTQLNRLANRLARQLVRYGVGPDTLVGLCLDRSNDLVVAILAILKAGGAYLPIDLAYPPERLAFILEDAQAPVLLTQRKLTSNLPSTKARIICVEEMLAEQAQPGEEETLHSSAGADHLAYVIYTSGTTGKPKGTLITHRNVVRLLASTEHWFGFNEHDVWTLFHSSAFDFSVWEIWGALLYGGRLVVVPFLVSRSPEMFYELLVKEQVTVLNQTPSAFRQLIQVEESGAVQLALRYIIFGGEALEMQSLRPWFARHGDMKPLLVNMYGITETTVHVTYRPLSNSDVESGSVIGVPIPDLEVYILDSRKRPVPVGVPGEMYVGGAGLARGYLRRPELTAQRFVPDHLTGRKDRRLYRTGDLARFLPGREIEYLGRIDEQVKIRGFRIELGEIESILCQHPAIREASVMAREIAPGSRQLVAYLVSPGPHPDLSELREHLKKKLPEYMIPAVFVFLETFPLTNNGKIDRKALPAPEPERPEMARPYAAPRTDAEQKLASIWSKVLRVEKVGVHDNFFELGGDSILSIQVISLARREGLKLTPKLLFENQTVAELSRVVGLAEDSNAKQEVLSGDLPLTPIEHWFFEQNLQDAHHYNQAFLLEVSGRLDREVLQSALQTVNNHHDALRLRFVREKGSWRQFYSTAGQQVPLDVVQIGNLSEESVREAIESAAASAQASLNFEAGPTWRVTYFDRGKDGAGRLLVVVHHLAVDGVSWRPLLEDMETAYLQLVRGLSLPLPAKTTSFKKWAESLQKFANSDSLKEEMPYWERCFDGDQLAKATAALAKTQSLQNSEGEARTLVTALSREETRQLLQQVPAAYSTQINDALLTALAEAWLRWTGSHVFFTNLEGHGRENLFEDVDLSRTVGWFTSIFPVRIELPGAGENRRPGEALKSVKEQLRKIPRRGIGYGLLRYLGKEQELNGLPEVPMVFNYLGQFDQALGTSKIFRFAGEFPGLLHSPKQQRRFALEVNSLVVHGQLEIRWTYCPELSSEPSVQSLADLFTRALQELIEHCCAQRPGGRTAADFPLVQLERNTLDKLLAEYSDVEDLYPLSPMQTLFFSANPAKAHTGFDQWQCTLKGELHVSAFQRAWHETVNRHTILRSSIHSEGLREPLQIVKRSVDLPWTLEDWTAVPVEQIDKRWNEFLSGDRAQPLDLSEAPVMRLHLVRLAGNCWKFSWSLPAFLLDGWSWPLVFRDASRIYESLTRSAEPQLESAPPYREYLRWLQKHSFEESKKFWREMFSGFSEPTPLPGAAPDPSLREERFVKHRIALPAGTAEALQAAARRLQFTPNSLVQGAWALLLSRQNKSADVVFGSAFSGRPTDLHGAESIVGPFVNTLPLRVAVNPQNKAALFFHQVHSLLLKLSSHQFTSLAEIQTCTKVPERRRLFDSLVVFQNYQIEDAAKSFGGQLQISDFVGPIHTNYPLLLLVEPQAGLQLTLIFDSQVLARRTVEAWGRDIAKLLEHIPTYLDQCVGDLQADLSAPVDLQQEQSRQPGVQMQNFVPAQSRSELAIAAVWTEMFGLDRVSVEENFFDLGGHSLLLVKMHRRLQETLYPELSIVTLFEHPTVRSLAQHLDQAGDASRGAATEESRHRARQQRQALEQLRARLKKSGS